jgi:hypothetical protein
MQHVSTLLTTGGEFTRIWHAGGNTVIVLRHFPLTGEWTLTANGTQQNSLQFNLDEHRLCKVEFIPQGNMFTARTGLSGYNYICTVNGVKLLENLERMSSTNTTTATNNNTIDESNITIDERVVIAGDLTAWYRIKRPESNTSSVSGVDIHRRFRDFYFLYAQVCSAFRGTHLYASIPVPPPKEIAIISNHLNIEFLQERRVRLQAWLQKLLTLPGIVGGLNPDVQEFLGLGGPEGVREISVVYFTKTLGMRLTQPQPVNISAEGKPIQSAFSVQVVEVLSAPTVPDPTQPEIRPGDMITRIAGESALMQTYDVALQLLRTSPRPLVVHFLGIRKQHQQTPITIISAANVQQVTALPITTPATAAVLSVKPIMVTSSNTNNHHHHNNSTINNETINNVIPPLPVKLSPKPKQHDEEEDVILDSTPTTTTQDIEI